jgi:type 1 glutamine amidotransferase
MKKTTFWFPYLFAFFFLLSGFVLQAQERVLVFTKVGSENGFAHASIDEGIQMITNLGSKNGLWETDDTDNADAFTAENLAKYAAIIWCNTSGDNLLNETQQQAFEDYIANGGGFVGIHAASDTYRNGSWPFYNELVGGIVQTNPNHTSSTYEATMSVVNAHPAVDFLNGSYTKVEEYYYWELNGGYLNPNNINILEVESTGNESYDAPRPMAWYKEYMGGRSFYTALGHNESDYTDDEDFIKHVEEGIKYAIGNTLGLAENQNSAKIVVYPNPAGNSINVQAAAPLTNVHVYDIQGRSIEQHQFSALNTTSYTFNSSSWSPGVYFIKADGQNGNETVRLIKK